MKKIFIIFAVLFLSVSCVKKDAIHFNGIENINIGGIALSGVTVEADLLVENSSRKDIEISNIDLDIKNKTEVIATAKLKENVTITKKSNDAVNAGLIIRSSNGVMSLMSTAKNYQALIVKGTVDIKIGKIKRTIEIPEMTIEQLIRNLEMFN